MTTMPTTIETTQPKAQRSFSVSLVDATGAVLRISAVKKRDRVETHAVHSTRGADKKWTNNRGATETWPNLDAARANLEKLVAAATKLGWTRRVAGAGFKPRPDAFSVNNLPKAKR